MRSQVERWDQLAPEELDAAVIDPKDIRGRKNRYISKLRNDAILETLDSSLSNQGVALDFGCGNGGISEQLARTGCWIVGVDISMGLLRRTAARGPLLKSVFVLYDGKSLPIRPASITTAVTWVVLNHIIDDADLHALLVQIRDTLIPGGKLVAIEQARRTPTTDMVAWQQRRSISGFSSLFKRAGFKIQNTTIIRYGKLPTTYAIRYGLIPTRLHAAVARFERLVGRMFGVLPWDYCDVRFVLTKNEAEPS